MRKNEALMWWYQTKLHTQSQGGGGRTGTVQSMLPRLYKMGREKQKAIHELLTHTFAGICTMYFWKNTPSTNNNGHL